MNHGGSSRADDFGRAVSKLAVAQICEGAGFHGVKESALDAFADIAIRYLVDLGKMANFYANLARRSECNVFDVIQGLEDLELTHGFPGASESSQWLGGSGTVRDIVNFVDSGEEIPFAHPIPKFPIIKERMEFRMSFQWGNSDQYVKLQPLTVVVAGDPHGGYRG